MYILRKRLRDGVRAAEAFARIDALQTPAFVTDV
jgi:hypothetical protein